MIIIYYHKNSVASVHDLSKNESVEIVEKYAFDALKNLSRRYSDRWMIWCDDAYKDHLSIDKIKKHLTHKRLLISHNVGNDQFLGKDLGYVEESPFITVPSGVVYPTWQMSGVGSIHCDTLAAINTLNIPSSHFLYAINSLAKQAQQIGLICKQIPLIEHDLARPKATQKMLFKFVANHYKKRWILILWFCQFYFKKRNNTLALLSTIFVSRGNIEGSLPAVYDDMKSGNSTIDVLIPTIGRKDYLYKVFEDLKAQTLLPQKVIVVEQNPEINSTSNLNYLTEEHWPFEIDHIFTHQTGACNARNLGLQRIGSEWLFMADDDIRFGASVLEESITFVKRYKTQAITLSCLQEGDMETETEPIQWNGFGSGCSIVHTGVLEGLTFDPALEHGFGEDADFGNQLRKKGVGIIYNPHIQLMHLKAPVGGFRAPWIAPWAKDSPKPSPTVMVSILKHWSLEQRQSYKLILFMKFYRLQSVKNPWSYLKKMRLRWKASLKWAHYLMKL